MGTTLLLCLVLVLAILSVYLQVASHPFLAYFDRIDRVTENPHVAGGLTGGNILWAFTSLEACNWHPATWLSHMTVAQFCGMNPAGHHLANVAIHTLGAVLLFLMLLRLTGALWQSFFVAALFGLHPMHVESVAWVAERKDVLSALFWFLSLFFYGEYVRTKPRPALYLLSLASFMLGLMSKAMLVTLPIVLLFLDFWPLDRYRQQALAKHRLSAGMLPLITEKIPFFVCSFAVALVTVYAQDRGGALQNFQVRPLELRVDNALVSTVGYLWKTVWPRELAFLYPYPLSLPRGEVIGSLLVLVLVSAGVIRAGRRHPFLALGWCWFLATLVPVIGLLQVGEQSMADRYAYLPGIGLFIMASWGVPELLQGVPHRGALLAVGAGVVIIAATAGTWEQVGYWRDDISLYRHTLEVTRGNYSIMNKLGLALAEKGDSDGAIRQYREALLLRPDDPETLNNLGLALLGRGDPDAAVRQFREALRLNPAQPEPHCNLGYALAGKGDLDQAIREYREALRINPTIASARDNLGVALARNGELDAAIREFREALAINPDLPQVRDNLGVVLALKRVGAPEPPGGRVTSNNR